MNRFLTGYPTSHLRILVAAVGGSPALLCVFDVQPFEHFGIVIVGGTEQGNGIDIMAK